MHILDDDFKKKWADRKMQITPKGYATLWYNGKNTFVHHLIMGKPPKGLETDHINGNPLDNRRSNLRFVDRATNCRNRTSYGTTGVKGVYHDKTSKRAKPYKVDVQDAYGKRKSLGYYATIEEAQKVADSFYNERALVEALMSQEHFNNYDSMPPSYNPSDDATVLSDVMGEMGDEY